MNSVKRESETRGRALFWAALAAILAVALAACDRPGVANQQRYTPPPPLALVAILDPTPDRLPGELRQLEGVISANATPGEAVVVMLLEPSFGADYLVKQGDSLSSIAAAHGLQLSALEVANPQLGPLSGRNWKLIHPGEHVILPNGAADGALLLVSRAPTGPTPPVLLPMPSPPNNPTDFQRAQYHHTVENNTATNDARIAAWRDTAARAIQPWQAQVVAQLEQKAAAADRLARQPDHSMLSASVSAGLTTLRGLEGRRVLLLLGGGDVGPAPLPAQSLEQVNLVVANLSDSQASAAWTAAANGAGAVSVNALDTALTQLQLPQVVNRHD